MNHPTHRPTAAVFRLEIPISRHETRGRRRRDSILGLLVLPGSDPLPPTYRLPSDMSMLLPKKRHSEAFPTAGRGRYIKKDPPSPSVKGACGVPKRATSRMCYRGGTCPLQPLSLSFLELLVGCL